MYPIYLLTGFINIRYDDVLNIVIFTSVGVAITAAKAPDDMLAIALFTTLSCWRLKHKKFIQQTTSIDKSL